MKRFHFTAVLLTHLPYMIGNVDVNPFIHHVEKWPKMLYELLRCSQRFLKHVFRPFLTNIRMKALGWSLNIVNAALLITGRTTNTMRY